MSNDKETENVMPKNISTPRKYPTAGQPTKYKSEYCEMMINHMAEGYSFEAFAGLIKVNKTTLYTWLALHKDFKEAKEIADEQSRLWAKTQLKEQIRGNLKSHLVPLLFFTKNKFPEEWRDRREIELQKDVKIRAII